ncbi:hypothetical protein HK098_004494 [Nowakowskiella sp. JEL0407]|nr:hypothetical protein HK098_004494 [Nowakowskiella sp. JEL0407]
MFTLRNRPGMRIVIFMAILLTTLYYIKSNFPHHINYQKDELLPSESLNTDKVLNNAHDGNEVVVNTKYSLATNPPVSEQSKVVRGSWYIPYKKYISMTPNPNTFTVESLFHDFPHNFSPLNPTTALEAAYVLAFLTDKVGDYVPKSVIPQIIHQTWKSRDAFYGKEASLKSGDPDHIHQSINSWRSRNPDVGYILWTDADALEFVQKLWPGVYPTYKKFPKMVMKADLFRYLVLSSFGGIYSDVDTLSLKPIKEWIQEKDVKPWVYPPATAKTNDALPPQRKFASTLPISFIVGVETDVPYSYNDTWKDYYYLPLQICQWTMASAPSARILGTTISKILNLVRLEEIRGNKALAGVDVTKLTGPGVWTETVYGFWREIGVEGMLLRGWGDNGRVFEDVLVFPITSFSPGLGQVLLTVFGNMGSKRIEDPDALVQHMWKSVWRATSG